MALPTLPAPGNGPVRSAEAPARPVPGLVVVGAVVVVAQVVGHLVPVLSPLVLGVLAGAVWANLLGVSARHRDGAHVAARTLLRVGIVLLGLRLSFGDLLALGGRGLAVVAATVTVTFFGTRWLGERMGLGRDLSLLVATGYSICGASAIAAMEPNTDADDADVAAAIGLVTLFGTLAIAVLPVLGDGLGLDPDTFGSWVGASTHDVAQVIATASTAGSVALSAAIVVKLTRIALLAPLVAGVSLRRRIEAGRADVAPDDDHDVSARPPLLPLFVVGFLIAAAIRSTGALPTGALEAGRVVESILLTAAMVGLGTGVRITQLRALGFRPLVLGAASWIVVAGVSLAGVTLVV